MSPLSGPPPAEVPLSNAPLVRVVAQVRFPLIASVDNQDFIAEFQEAIRHDYPVLRPEHSTGVVFGPQGPVSTRKSTVWRFEDTSGQWRVSLAPDFLALESLKYTSRDDFFNRLNQVIATLHKQLDIQVIDRIGVRYIDRIRGDNLRELPNLVTPQVAGIMASNIANAVSLSITESLFDLPDGSGRVLARWGMVPPNMTIDPAAVEPIDEQSWILDLDAFIEKTRPFNIDNILMEARGFSERIYSVFRWVVNDEFLRRYGGEL